MLLPRPCLKSSSPRAFSFARLSPPSGRKSKNRQTRAPSLATKDDLAKNIRGKVFIPASPSPTTPTRPDRAALPVMSIPRERRDTWLPQQPRRQRSSRRRLKKPEESGKERHTATFQVGDDDDDNTRLQQFRYRDRRLVPDFGFARATVASTSRKDETRPIRPWAPLSTRTTTILPAKRGRRRLHGRRLTRTQIHKLR